ncbi:hypothetical protein KKG52_02970 [Patescibacteria group bacterium]|nr:hypothetical protein [Patescibacteria group bacterium]
MKQLLMFLNGNVFFSKMLSFSRSILGSLLLSIVLGFVLGFMFLALTFFIPNLQPLLIGKPIAEQLGLYGFRSELFSSIATGLLLGILAIALTSVGLKKASGLNTKLEMESEVVRV